jgi:hypothetical protein
MQTEAGERKRGGRPRGGRYTEQTYVRLAPEDRRRLDALGALWKTKDAATVRRALELAAKAAGLE